MESGKVLWEPIGIIMKNVSLDLVKRHLLKFQLKDRKGDLQIMFISMNLNIESNECFYKSKSCEIEMESGKI